MPMVSLEKLLILVGDTMIMLDLSNNTTIKFTYLHCHCILVDMKTHVEVGGESMPGVS